MLFSATPCNQFFFFFASMMNLLIAIIGAVLAAAVAAAAAAAGTTTYNGDEIVITNSCAASAPSSARSFYALSSQANANVGEAGAFSGCQTGFVAGAGGVNSVKVSCNANMTWNLTTVIYTINRYSDAACASLQRQDTYVSGVPVDRAFCDPQLQSISYYCVFRGKTRHSALTENDTPMECPTTSPQPVQAAATMDFNPSDGWTWDSYYDACNQRLLVSDVEPKTGQAPIIIRALTQNSAAYAGQSAFVPFKNSRELQSNSMELAYDRIRGVV